MWHRIVYIIIASVQMTVVNGQRVTSKVPDIGSKISYVSYNEDGYLDLDNTGEGAIWDYAFFKTPYQREYLIERPSNGKYGSRFPNADFVSKEANEQEVYYRVSGNNLLELGRSGGFWYLENIHQPLKYSTNPVVRKSGMSMGQRYSDKSDFAITVGIEDISQFRDIQIPLSTDSIRYDVSITREVVADGKGQLILPQSFYDVIRIKQEIEVVINVYAKGRLGWQEFGTNLNHGSNISDLVQGTFHLERFEYWSEDHAFPILVIERNEQGNKRVNYMMTDSNIPMIRVYGSKKDVLAYPNPTYGEIEFQLVNLPPGAYTLQIYNIVSKPLHTSTFDVDRTRTINTDLSFLSKGTYLYSIIDPQGNKVVTKRVMIITP